MRASKAYSPEYIEKCFSVWYATEYREITPELMSKLPPDEHGRVPALEVVRKWRKNHGWLEHAENLDNRALEVRDTRLVMQKAALLQKQAEDSFLLASKAHTHLISGTFDSSAAAVNAYFRATEEVRKVIGLSDLLQRLGQMSDEEVQNEIKSRLTRAAEANQVIVDGETEELVGDSNEETS